MTRFLPAVVVMGLAFASAQAAEVHLATGKVLQVRSVRAGEAETWLDLSDGGAMAIPNELIVEIRGIRGIRETRESSLVSVEPASLTGLASGEREQPIPTQGATEDGVRPGGNTRNPPPAGAGTLDSIIRAAAARHALDPELVRAVIQAESAGNARAVSPRGAMGLMQLMPATARARGVTDPFDPEQNIDAGTAELAAWIDGYAGEIALALAAYNAGGRAVDRHDGIPPYRETLDYVRRVLNLYLDEPLAD